MLDIILFQPEIPPNTGNIVRLCANTGYRLHLIEPLGFDLEEKKVRRAGLDYREFASVKRHDSLESYLRKNPETTIYACTTKGSRWFTEPQFKAGDGLLFGPETRGLPDDIIQILPPEQRLRIPMLPDSRSMNLSNAVSVFVYESWRQLNFEGAI